MTMESPRVIESNWQTPIKMWEVDELSEAIIKLRGIDNPFEQNQDLSLLTKIFSLDGYFLKTNLFYTPPQAWSDGLGSVLIPYPEETQVRIAILGNGSYRIEQLPIYLDFSVPNEEYDLDWSAKIRLAVSFGNGFKANGIMEVEENGDINHFAYQDNKEPITLPSNPQILSYTWLKVDKTNPLRLP